MSGDGLARWAAAFDVPTQRELDDSEPLDDPPAGFADWGAWREHRWPATRGEDSDN